MTAMKVNVLSCDKSDCTQVLRAGEGESARDLRHRAATVHGWRSFPSLLQGGHTDLCRWHA